MWKFLFKFFKNASHIDYVEKTVLFQSSAIAVNNRRNSMAQDLAVLQQQALLAAQTYNNRMR